VVKGGRVSDRVPNCSTGVMNNIRNARACFSVWPVQRLGYPPCLNQDVVESLYDESSISGFFYVAFTYMRLVDESFNANAG
jgi:hypothetical protein